MRNATRVLTVLVVAALALSGPVAAHATQGESETARHQRQLLKTIDNVSDHLDRSVKPSRIDMLSATTQAGLVANVAADKAALGEVATAAQAVGSTLDLRQARTDVKELRPENYRLVVNVLRKAERLLADATAGSAAATALSAVVTEGLTVDASTERSVLRDLRADLKAAKDLVAPSAG